MIKRTISVIIAACMIIAMMPAWEAFAADNNSTTAGSIKYSYTTTGDKNIATVTGY